MCKISRKKDLTGVKIFQKVLEGLVFLNNLYGTNIPTLIGLGFCDFLNIFQTLFLLTGRGRDSLRQFHHFPKRQGI